MECLCPRIVVLGATPLCEDRAPCRAIVVPSGGPLSAALAEFNKKFQEKTKNAWARRSSFTTYPYVTAPRVAGVCVCWSVVTVLLGRRSCRGKYTLIEMSYDDDAGPAGAGSGGPAAAVSSKPVRSGQ